MNPFQAFVASLEADVNINIDVNEASTSNEPELEVSSPVTEEALAADTAVVEQEEVVDTITTGVASLESIYQTLEQVSQERDTLTETEVSFMQIALSGIAKPMGGRATDLVPSIESDNYFERNDVVASMESVGAAMKAGAKAGYEALKNLLVKLKEWFNNAVTRAKGLKDRFKIACSRIIAKEVYTLEYPTFDKMYDLDEILKDLTTRVDALSNDRFYKPDESEVSARTPTETSTRSNRRMKFKGADLIAAFNKCAVLSEKLESLDYINRINKAEREVLINQERSIEHQKSLDLSTKRTEKGYNASVALFQAARDEYNLLINTLAQFKISKVKEGEDAE